MGRESKSQELNRSKARFRINFLHQVLMAVRQRLNISRWAIRHPKLTIGFWVAVVIAGLLAFGSMKYALFPDVTFPIVVVNAQNATMQSALETESRITEPIERKLRDLKNLDDIRSTTSQGNTTIKIAFQVGKELVSAKKNVMDAIKTTDLPKQTNIDTISLNLNESTAVKYIALSETMSTEEIAKTTRSVIIPKLKSINGVLDVRPIGLEKSPAEGPSGAGLETYPLTAASLNGKAGIGIEIIKKANINTLDLVKRSDEIAKELQKNLKNINIIQASTQANYIKEASHATIDSIGLAVALSAIIIYPFLWDWKATLISALAIPTSLFGTFIVMAIFGLKLETITMLAIALVVGIIVDDAIVDVENISRHIELGENPRRATISATDEVGLTLSAATLTIAAVFIPVATMGGVVGQFFRPFGITASAAVLISLLVSRTLSPLLSMYWLRKKPTKKEDHRWSSLLNWYRTRLTGALKRRKLIIVLTVASLIIGIGLALTVNKGFIPKLDRGEFIINYTSNVETVLSPDKIKQINRQQNPNSQLAMLEKSKKDAQKIELIIGKIAEVEDIYTTVGGRWGEPNRGELIVKLKKERNKNTSAVQKEVRETLANFTDISTGVEDIPFVDTGSAKPIQINLYGDNLTNLNKVTRKLQVEIERIPGIVDVTSNKGPEGVEGINVIDHYNGKRVNTIEANTSFSMTADRAKALMIREAKGLIPSNVKLQYGGESSRIGEIMTSFATTMLLGVACISIVLFLLFKNWKDPLIIIFSLPLSLIGAMLALIITGQDLGIISVIGIIFLMGLTNKNAIIMVDYINQLRRSGLETQNAILKGATVRLRPILMTTGATLLGMLPVSIGVGAGSEMRAPMAIAIMGGLFASSILSLIVIPVVYSLMAETNLNYFKASSTKETWN